jgi:hypothetical protein
MSPSTESESCIPTDGQSASLSWNKAPIWGLRPDFYYCQTVAGLLIWDAVSDERTGMSFTIVAGPRQRTHSGVRIPWDSRPYFYCLRFETSFLSPPTTRRATVEVFDPASTRDINCKLRYIKLNVLRIIQSEEGKIFRVKTCSVPRPTLFRITKLLRNYKCFLVIVNNPHTLLYY